MNSTRALFFDIDHTLFSHTTHSVPASAYRALRALKSRGCKIAICTSRVKEELIDLPQELMDLMDGMVCAQGAVIYEANQVIQTLTIDPEDVKAVIQFCRDNQLVIRWAGKHGENCHDQHYTQEVSDLFYHLYRMRPDRKEWNGEECVNIIFYSQDDEMIEKIKPCVTHSHLMVMHFANEVTHAQATKGNGMLQLARHWGYAQEETVAFGDGYNDVNMLESAGVGIAMGNGCQAAKDAADYVAEDIDHDAIYKACQHFGWIDKED